MATLSIMNIADIDKVDGETLDIWIEEIEDMKERKRKKGEIKAIAVLNVVKALIEIEVKERRVGRP